WKRVQSWMDDLLGEAVGRLFVERHFRAGAKAKASEIVKSISAAFVRRIDALDWMAPATKAGAKAEGPALYGGGGDPDHWHGREGRPGRQRGRCQPLPSRAGAGEAREAGGPDGVVHATARGQRGEPAGAERAEHPGRHPAAALLRARCAGGGQLRVDRRHGRP